MTQEQKNWVEQIWDKTVAKMECMSERNKEKLPYTSIDGVYDDRSVNDVNWWTNGFWAGTNWMLYKATGKTVFRQTAECSEKLLDKAFENYDALHHDVGFMWHISAGADYRITGNREARTRALFAANVLFSRYNLAGGYIRAWNGKGTAGWAIIDCMMNIPLLYWASNETGDACFRQVATAHADKTMTHHLRQDGSVKHIVSYDPQTGDDLGEVPGQGFAPGSSWSRGQAWALYGYTISWRYTGNEEYLNAAKRTAHYFIANVCDDWLPKCDFRAPKEPVIYDSTAGAVAACGLLALAEAVPEQEKAPYFNAAMCLMKAMESRFCDWDVTKDGILQMGTERYHSDKGRHIHIIYGDYFFVEALGRLKKLDVALW